MLKIHGAAFCFFAFALVCIQSPVVGAATGESNQKSKASSAGKAGNCYKQNKPRWPYVDGGDYPVCKAVLAVMNSTCDGPRQRTIKPGAKSPISLPMWTDLDPAANVRFAPYVDSKLIPTTGVGINLQVLPNLDAVLRAFSFDPASLANDRLDSGWTGATIFALRSG